MDEKDKKAETIYITEDELGSPPAYNAGGTAQSTYARQEVRLCPSCHRQITPETTYCQFCGAGPLRPTTSYEVKKKGTAALLAVIPGILGFFGIAHFYLERLAVGFLFLFAGWSILAASLLCWLLLGEWVWAIVLVLVWLGMFVWQVFDAVGIAEEHYRVLDNL